MSWSNASRWFTASAIVLSMTVITSAAASAFQGGVGPVHSEKTTNNQPLNRSNMVPPGG